LKSLRVKLKPFQFGKVLSYYRVIFFDTLAYPIFIIISIFAFNQSVAAKTIEKEMKLSAVKLCELGQIRDYQDAYYSKYFGKSFNSNIGLTQYKQPNINKPTFDFETIGSKSHQQEIFTQGFVVDSNNYYETSGGLGNSYLYKFSKKKVSYF